jgi:hypothetical protein
MASALDERDVEDFDRIAKKILAEFADSVESNGKS